MRFVRPAAALLLAALVFWALNERHGMVPPAGKLLNPFAGFWANGDRSDSPPERLDVPGLRAEVRVLWDGRRVPHVFAADDRDLYFAQGYLTARDRLWQMEFQTLYAAGRLTEIVGRAALPQDRLFRRIGMAWAAENVARAFAGDEVTRSVLQAYSDGVNAWIARLRPRDLPVEYKILDYRPEPWTPLKSALLQTLMAHDLTFFDRDEALTAMREALGRDTVDRLFPREQPFTDPVVPRGTPWAFAPLPLPLPPRGEGPPELEAGLRPGSALPAAPDDPVRIVRGGGDGLGSNNWAVSGRLTRSGFPILCNDIHLGYSLPAIWHEIQLSAPGVNVYGVTFPGAPGVVAGFNERTAWGYTNATSDVVDWYAMKFRDKSQGEYLYDGAWTKTSLRVEEYKVRGGRRFTERVVYTHFGPVTQPAGEPRLAPGIPPDAALRWAAHQPTNLMGAIHAIDRAKSYDEHVAAVTSWSCPGQNIVFADADGTIAIRHQGLYPLRWKGQGRFVLDGSDPADEWHGWVPADQVPAVRDPERGFVSSANQNPAGEDYPYDLGWDYADFERGARINEILSAARAVTPEDMIRMQSDDVSLRARMVRPRALEYLRDREWSGVEKRVKDDLEAWDDRCRADSAAATEFDRFWDELNAAIWNDERRAPMTTVPWPASGVTIDLLLNRPDSDVWDDRATPEREGPRDIVVRAFRKTCAALEKELGPPGPAWAWGRARVVELGHVARIPGLGRRVEMAGGADGTINAISRRHGPSWRMVVELGPEVRGWGIYPGGQSGNPGSRFYESMVDDYVAGKPYPLLFLKSPDDKRAGVAGGTVLAPGGSR